MGEGEERSLRYQVMKHLPGVVEKVAGADRGCGFRAKLKGVKEPSVAGPSVTTAAASVMIGSTVVTAAAVAAKLVAATVAAAAAPVPGDIDRTRKARRVAAMWVSE